MTLRNSFIAVLLASSAIMPFGITSSHAAVTDRLCDHAWAQIFLPQCHEEVTGSIDTSAKPTSENKASAGPSVKTVPPADEDDKVVVVVPDEETATPGDETGGDDEVTPGDETGGDDEVTPGDETGGDDEATAEDPDEPFDFAGYWNSLRDYVTTYAPTGIWSMEEVAVIVDELYFKGLEETTTGPDLDRLYEERVKQRVAELDAQGKIDADEATWNFPEEELQEKKERIREIIEGDSPENLWSEEELDQLTEELASLYVKVTSTAEDLDGLLQKRIQEKLASLEEQEEPVAAVEEAPAVAAFAAVAIEDEIVTPAEDPAAPPADSDAAADEEVPAAEPTAAADEEPATKQPAESTEAPATEQPAESTEAPAAEQPTENTEAPATEQPTESTEAPAAEQPAESTEAPSDGGNEPAASETSSESSASETDSSSASDSGDSGSSSESGGSDSESSSNEGSSES